MGIIWFLDSNIIIYLSQKKLDVNDIFKDDTSYAISVITYMEILSYNFAHKEEGLFIKSLLSLFNIIEIDKNIATEVIKLKKQRKIKLPYAIIIATAILYNATLYTNDKQLSTIENLQIKSFLI